MTKRPPKETVPFNLPYGRVEIPRGIIPVAARRVAGLAAASFSLATPQQIAMGAYLQGVEDCYAALDHAGRLTP